MKRSSSIGQTVRADQSAVSQPVVPACGTWRPSTSVQDISNDRPVVRWPGSHGKHQSFGRWLCSASFDDTHRFEICGRGGRTGVVETGGIEGNNYKVGNLILGASNGEQRCAMTYPVSDAQACPLERAWVEVYVCGRTCEPT